MPNAIKYGALGSLTTAIAGGATGPTLKNLQADARKLGNEIDRTASGNREQGSLWLLKCKCVATPAGGAYVPLYLIKSVDGANYEYGDDSNDPPASAWVGNFPLQLTTAQQYIAIDGITLPNCKFKPWVKNKAGTGAHFSNVDDENILSYRYYDPDEVQ